MWRRGGRGKRDRRNKQSLRCERGEKTTTPPHSSIVGASPVHYPSGNVCMKHMGIMSLTTLI